MIKVDVYAAVVQCLHSRTQACRSKVGLYFTFKFQYL